MAFEMSMLSVDLLVGRTMVVLKDEEMDRQIQLMMRIETPDGALEAEMRETARGAVQHALRDALAAM